MYTKHPCLCLFLLGYPVVSMHLSLKHGGLTQWEKNACLPGLQLQNIVCLEAGQIISRLLLAL